MRVLGLMSGTSADAIDCAVAEFSESGGRLDMRLLWHGEQPWDEGLRARILGVLPPATSTVADWCQLDTEIGQAFGAAASAAIAEAGPVDLIASHGQTLFHWVENGKARGSLQVGNPAWIQAATGTPVVSDFRIADIAAGGHGAPLTSTFDAMWLGETPTALLNLGGIANVTVVGLSDGALTGDTGPANCLLDAAAHRFHGLPADLGGALARAGRVDERALAILLADPFFAQPLPRSTGREYFDGDYVARRLVDVTLEGADLFATLTELTARTVADVINRASVRRVVASGGGIHNPFLMERLAALLEAPLLTADELGLPSDAKEAYVFALLGYLSATGRPGVVVGAGGRAATGATHPTVLGTLTPAGSGQPAAPAITLALHNQEEA